MKGKVFTAQEVQAMLNGSKVIFREVIKPQPTNENQVFGLNVSSSKKSNEDKYHFINPSNTLDKTDYFKCPYQVGQKIFCKESFGSYYEDDGLVRGDIFLYRADEDSKDLDDVHWKPAQHMKQEHSRLTLLIKEIKVERLQELSRGDCMAEGCPFPNIAKETNPKEWFADNWNATHKKPEEKFEASPWVWSILFEVVNG